MTVVARVLYENHRSEATEYGLHTLVCAMADDQCGAPGSWTARGVVKCATRNGRDKLLRDCREPERSFASLPREARFAVIDGDELHAVGTLGLAADASLDIRRAALERAYPGVTFIVPDADRPATSNTEGLLRLTAQCLGLAEHDATLVNALVKGRGSMIARDRLFNRAAAAPASVRACILQGQPSLARLVTALAALVDSTLRSSS